MTSAQTYLVSFCGDGAEKIFATPVGRNLPRLEAAPLSADFATYGDVIEVELHLNGTLQFVRLVTRSTFITYRITVPRIGLGTAYLDAFLKRVNAIGGRWEKLFGGTLFLHIPRDVEFDVDGEMTALLAQIAGG